MRLGVWTLRRKMIALLLVASTLPLAITAYLVFREARDRLLDDARARLIAAGAGVSAQLDGLHQHFFTVIQHLAHQPSVRDACAAIGAARPPGDDALAVLRAFQTGDERLRAVSITDTSGRMVLSTSEQYHGVDLRSRGWFRAAQARRGPALEVVVADRYAQEVPLLAIAEAFEGCTIVLGVRAEALFEPVRQASGAAGEGSFAILVDEHGVRIAHGLRDDLVFRPTGALPDAEREQMIADRRFGTRTAELLDQAIDTPVQFERARAAVLTGAGRILEFVAPGNDARNYAVAHRLTTAPWTVFVLVPTDAVEAPAAALLRVAAPVSLAVVVVAFVVGLVITERIIGPLRRLTAASAAIARGDREQRIEISTSDEVAELAHHFNEMAAAVARSTEQLEHRIKDRTQALMIRNDELKAYQEELLAHRAELVAQRDELERKNQDVERADRMKSEFLANMSHELRTPLNSVIGFADLLQVTAEDRLEPDERAHLRDIVAAGRHLLLIINDILDLAKIEAGHVRLELDAVAPEEVVGDAVAMVQATVRARRLDLRTSFRATRTVRADAARLRQVVLNLLSNAVKFSPDGGAIDVRVTDDGDHVLFEVTDRGPGIPAELAAQLFQPFVQGEGALVKKHQGTGLGLAISKKLVELHGGEIELDSRVGHGTTFRVRVPAAGARAATPGADAVATVLLVVATPANHGHRARLEAAGYRVETAPSDADLAEAAHAAGATLIVIDVHEATADAPAILERASRLAAHLPVVLLGGDADLLVPKPLEPGVLRALGRRLLEGVGAPRRVLVIDDDPRVAELVAAALGDGYAVEGAATAADGLARAATGAFDLHVVDLTLPDGRGDDVLEQLAAGETTRGTPRIVLTAAQLDAAHRDRLRRHAQAVAPKGAVTPEELLGVVDRLVRGEPAAAPADGRRTILVVDDHDMNRDLARSILERRGYRIVEARDGAEALALAEREPPSLILMDLAMPGIDGFTATRRLKEHPALGRIPVVALSAMAMRADEERARAAGVDAFLTKPVDRVALERTVDRLVAGVA